MPVVGTAGHVDHGKSTLVRALTGRDPDRWDEEKRRGLTIDLGFAWTDLDGMEVGFVDVPGHERFIKNMLAGVDGIDVALFIVAADEGWMPQSEEHLAVLDLLGVDRGVVALTRIDLVDDELAELAALEVEEHLEGSSLAGSPVVPVAAPEGRGVAEVRAALRAALATGAPPADAGRPRLWVDRSFIISGAGTVVTGTLTGGRLAVGDTVAVWPGAAETRVRSIQSHEHARDHAEPGSRTALNLVGLERHDIARGAMIGLPGQWRTTDRALVALRTVRTLDEPLESRGAYHLHVGSGAWAVRMRVLRPPEEAQPGVALLRLPTRLPLQMGDRFILRDVGRRAVVAGGRVLDPAALAGNDNEWRHAAAGLLAALDGSPGERAAALLEVRGSAARDDLAADSGGGAVPSDSVVEGVALAAHRRRELVDAISGAVRDYQGAHPLRAGIPKATVATALGVPLAQVDWLAGEVPELVDDGATLRTHDFDQGWGEPDRQTWEKARSVLLGEGLAVPRASQLGLGDELFHAALRRELLVKVGDDLVYLPEQLTEAVERLTALGDGFSVAEARDALTVTRRHAVPLLEHLDRTGVTVREGDLRRIRRPRSGEPAPSADQTR